MLKYPSETKIRPKSNQIRKYYGLLLMGHAFLSSIDNTIHERYNELLDNYDDFLDSNFDGIQKSLSPLAQIYLSGKVDNDVYTYTEMMKQPDRYKFKTAMYKEMKLMFDNDIWKKVTRTSMLRFYGQQLNLGKDIKQR